MDWVSQYRSPPKKGDKPSGKSISSPPGFDEQFYRQWKEGKVKPQGKISNKNSDLEELKYERAWDLAKSPAKSIPMNLIMMYMSPNSLQLIPVVMVLMLFVNSIKEIFQVREKFRDLELNDNQGKTFLQFLYVACCCGNMAIGVWKLNKLGLIPNRSSDWLSWEPIEV
ncbi:hypothetical protein KL930_001274 [Ogataea haglerorum]|uniref:ER membrane protein complex subunit 4 n=1 Tax=Ogataea haglerorum TaxID=1937702 RepID=A0AAN6D502_9ASCO|nr:hypothetical protein KL915_003184 [Ogataea haglerorum]KAG7698496.1 hypothetical protein KL951_001760 [Ogataea haglerorum]KAG7706276.1 hypothetical protein KL914_003171 [Ogataea haglerorum]KAG7708011.1 hypothetical protein KL950_002637 [Ogataea haglerorum]KAG7717191.1 hypothetical protein KL913_002942 [Ogataea haglerorum]